MNGKGPDEGLTMTFARKVKEEREKLGINQKQLVEASDISQATISRIESGRMEQLKSRTLKRLADALGVTVDYLVQDDRPLRVRKSDLRHLEVCLILVKNIGQRFSKKFTKNEDDAFWHVVQAAERQHKKEELEIQELEGGD